jgi:glutathione synthase/RimK-type ligase-like ATP-grasp enzyme
VSGTTLVLGLASEPPVAAVARELAGLGTPFVLADQRKLVTGELDLWWADGRAGGRLTLDGQTVDLDDVRAVYTRLTTWADLPETRAEPALLGHAYRLHQGLESWLEAAPARVVNRSSANDSNNSKPYQALVIRDHFDIPETVVTTDPDTAVAFAQAMGTTVYKSVSGERSVVTSFTAADVDRLPLLANGPVQFQAYVPGTDVRVHVVGDEVFATRIDADGVDYRYTSGAHMTPTALAAPVAEACRALTRRLGLELSGIDLRFTPDGRIVCFEVNPSPAYSVFEDETGQPIAAALARHLASAPA